MKIIISSTVLAGAVKNLCRVINAKCALPILADVLCEVDEQQRTLTMTASDSETWAQQQLMLTECEGGGRFAVSATRLMEAVGELSEQPVTILATTESDNQFRLQHATGEAYFPLDNAEEYPAVPELTDAQGAGLRVADVLAALNAVQWATATDDLRPQMSGVYFNFQREQTDIVASDGHVLMRYRMAEERDTEGAFIMPKKAAKLLPSMLAGMDADDVVAIDWTAGKAQVDGEGWTLTFCLIEGRYPNYESVIPKGQPYECGVVRQSLISAVRKVSPFASDSSQLLRCLFERERLTLTGEDYDFQAGATDRIYAEANVTAPLTIGMKASTLAAMLQKLPYAELTLRMTDPSRAVTLEEKPQEGKTSKQLGSLLGLVMPMMVNE